MKRDIKIAPRYKNNSYVPCFKRLVSVLYAPGPIEGAVLPTVWPKFRGERLYMA